MGLAQLDSQGIATEHASILEHVALHQCASHDQLETNWRRIGDRLETHQRGIGQLDAVQLLLHL